MRSPLAALEEGAMLIGKVIGTVVATRKEDSLQGLKFLSLKTVDLHLHATGGIVVAVDAVGAGIGEYVLYATGSASRQTTMTHERPVDAVIMAIIDNMEVGGEDRYIKDETFEADMMDLND